MINFLNIGNVSIEKTAALAPMASVSDYVYRVLCKKFKAAYVVGEMVSAKGLCFNKTLFEPYLQIRDSERPMAIQLFGSEPYYFEKAMEHVLAHKPDIVDLNMGCPVKKVVKTGAGCRLMTNPSLAENIAKVVIKNSNVPVTVKIRAGWSGSSLNVVEFAKRMENCGVSAVTVHARTKEQLYSGKSNWQLIKQVKSVLKIPVIASGDVVDAISAKKLYDETKADLIMIGRGSFGRPWIFKEVDFFLKTGKLLKEPSLYEKMETMLWHVKQLCEFYGEKKGIRKARFHAINYFYGFENAAKFRQKCANLKSFDDVVYLCKLANNSNFC